VCFGYPQVCKADLVVGVDAITRIARLDKVKVIACGRINQCVQSRHKTIEARPTVGSQAGLSRFVREFRRSGRSDEGGWHSELGTCLATRWRELQYYYYWCWSSLSRSRSRIVRRPARVRVTWPMKQQPSRMCLRCPPPRSSCRRHLAAGDNGLLIRQGSRSKPRREPRSRT
jgi:hypothetical protein